MDAFDTSPLCPAATELRVDVVAYTASELIITASARRHVVRCPACGHASARVHSRYQRTLGDLPWHGLRVRLMLRVRRFFCDVPGCARRIFTERLPNTAAAYARRTQRAARALEEIAFALGGRAGARLAATLGLLAGPATLLALVRGAPEPPVPTPRVLGVDDWALRKGQRYGTVLVDLERHRVIDLLPDREAATFAAWLAAHPGIECISRDRGGAYAEGARQGAPEAIQIADRFHLLQNLQAALERACTRHAPSLRAAAVATQPALLARATTRKRRYSGLPNNTERPTAGEQRSAERRARRLGRYDEVVALRAAGVPKKQIARRVGLDRRTVETWLAAGEFPERAARARRAHPLDAVADYLLARYDAGLDNAAQLARELQQRGCSCSVPSVRRYLAVLRRRRPRGASAPVGPPTVSPAPSPRAVAWLLRKAAAHPDTLQEDERAYVTALCASCPPLAEARRIAAAFTHMLASHDANALDPWLAAAAGTELHAFAAGLRRDHDAVLAALLFRWSNGQVEGQVHRLKLIKRSMYGRASLDLLRRRLTHAA